MTLRIGSLFSGYGGLDMGVQSVLAGEIAWHCQFEPPGKDGRPDKWQYAARILAHHWPEVPNLGDITAVDWQRVLEEFGPIDVLTGGFPCTDLSSAGQRLGLMIGTRSGLWHRMLRAIIALQPRLVVIENVRGILSTQARSGVEPCPSCVEYAGRKPLLRALGAVLGDLASIGFDAEWAGVQAAEVGATHERFREFILAWPADADGPGLEGRRVLGAVAERAAAAADADDVGRERDRGARRGQPGPSHNGGAAADADGDAVRQQSVAECGGCGTPVAGLDHAEAAADASRLGRREGWSESAGQLGRLDSAERRGATAADTESRRRDDGELPSGRDPVQQRVRDDAAGRGETAADADGSGRDQSERVVRAGQPDVEWGEYESAVRRWETVLGRRHPWPTDDRGRLAPEFSEWMMGLPEGHVCSVPPSPGMTEPALRNARLKALGNGVVPLQAAVAVRYLLDRVSPEVPAIRQLVDDVDHYSRRAA